MPNYTQDLVEEEFTEVLDALRPALAAVLEGLSPPIRRPTDLRRRLGLDQRLSWSVYNAAMATDRRVLASVLPGGRAMERFFRAAGRQGVPAESIASAQGAFERFEESVRRHAGSRDVYAAMVAELGGAEPFSPPAAGAHLRHKRSVFRGMALLWGRRARVNFASIAVQPGGAGGLLDRVRVSGLVGLHRTRRGVPLHVMVRKWHVPTKGDPAGPVQFEALEPGDPSAVGLLREFCSQPPPTFRTSVREDGYVTEELVASGVGSSSEVTFFAGYATRGCGVAPGSVPGSEITLMVAGDTPVEAAVCDVLMHERVWDERLPEVSVYRWPLHFGSPAEFHDLDLLPLTERAVYLGRGLEQGRTPLVPRYVEMMSYALGRVGWEPGRFRLFRCLVAYPLMYSRIRIRLACEGVEGGAG